MPDLLSHLLSGHIAGTALRSNRRGWLAVLLLGVLLPDLLTRPIYILWPAAYWLVKPLHTPIGITLTCLALSAFFVRTQRNLALAMLFTGSGLHLLLDLLQKHLHGGYALLFPFSWRSFEFGLFWPEETLWGLPLWLLLYGFSCLLLKRKNALQTSQERRDD